MAFQQASAEAAVIQHHRSPSQTEASAYLMRSCCARQGHRLTASFFITSSPCYEFNGRHCTKRGLCYGSFCHPGTYLLPWNVLPPRDVLSLYQIWWTACSVCVARARTHAHTHTHTHTHFYHPGTFRHHVLTKIVPKASLAAILVNPSPATL